MANKFWAFIPFVLIFWSSADLRANPGNSPEKDDLRRLTYSDVDRGRARFFPPLWSAGVLSGPITPYDKGETEIPWTP